MYFSLEDRSVLLRFDKNILLFIYLSFVVLFSQIPIFSVYYIVRGMSSFMMIIGVLFIFINWKILIDKSYIRDKLILFSVYFISFSSFFFNDDIPSPVELIFPLFVYFVVRIKNIYRICIYDYFIRLLSLIFLLGICEFIFFLFTNRLFFDFGYVEREDAGQVFVHGLFSMINVGEIFYRFQSIFDEPGRVGTLCGFMLFILDYNRYRKEFIVFLIAGILSLSLAYYVFLVIFLFIYIFSIRSLRQIILLLCVAITFGVAYSYNKDAFDVGVFDRISVGYENGTLDNRTKDSAKSKLITDFNNGDIYWIGHGLNASLGNGNAGLFSRYYSIGIIGIILLFITYNSLLFTHNYSSNRMLLFFVFWLSFYQRDYYFNPPDILLVTTYCSMPVLCNKSK